MVVMLIVTRTRDLPGGACSPGASVTQAERGEEDAGGTGFHMAAPPTEQKAG
jgi:hypothetical protein